MDYRTYPLEIKSLNEELGIFEGYASVFGNADAYGDVIEHGAFAGGLGNVEEIPILWQHNPDYLIGKTLAAREDATGLYVKGLLVLGAEKGRDAYALLKAGALRGLSIGFETVRATHDAARNVRRVQEVSLWEWSLVTFPANRQARVSAVKGTDSSTAIRALLREMREYRV